MLLLASIRLLLLATTCNKKALRFEIEFCEEEQIVFHGKFIALLLLSSCDFGMVNVSIQHFSSLASTVLNLSLRNVISQMSTDIKCVSSFMCSCVRRSLKFAIKLGCNLLQYKQVLCTHFIVFLASLRIILNAN